MDNKRQCIQRSLAECLETWRRRPAATFKVSGLIGEGTPLTGYGHGWHCKWAAQKGSAFPLDPPRYRGWAPSSTFHTPLAGSSLADVSDSRGHWGAGREWNDLILCSVLDGRWLYGGGWRCDYSVERGCVFLLSRDGRQINGNCGFLLKVSSLLAPANLFLMNILGQFSWQNL